MRILLLIILALAGLTSGTGHAQTATNVTQGSAENPSDSAGLVALYTALALSSEIGPGFESDFVAGWQALGTCTTPSQINAVNRDSVLAHLEIMRRYGLNTVRETANSDGRIVARRVGDSWYNWYGYRYVDADGQARRSGHPRPGAFVEGMRWMLDAAYGKEGDKHISLIVGLHRFVTPGYEASPFSGSDELSCQTYRDFIETERRNNPPGTRAGIPAVPCESAPNRIPFWKWNLWYVVTNLGDHPGLRAWYLWDEPEGTGRRHLFGSPPGIPRAYTGPESLPTTDLLRHVYRFVRQVDGERHPLIVDLHSPHVFFSDRFAWSEEPDPAWSSGPFDVTPTGEIDVPADIIGLEASSYVIHARGTEETEPVAWYWDINHISRKSEMLADVAKRDQKGAMVIAAQAHLPDQGPYGVGDPLRCELPDQPRTRLLTDRDLIWALLTTHINGLYGYVYYSHAHMPYRGPGAEQVDRSNRLLGQFLDARLDEVFAQPNLTDRIRSVDIHLKGLTDYYRNPPVSVGSIGARVDDTLDASMSRFLAPSEYRVGTFNRSSAESNYGAPVMRYTRYVLYPTHRLLRISLKHFEQTDYLFISNAFDSRITAHIRLQTKAFTGEVSEGLFDLDRNGSFRWSPYADGYRRDTTGPLVLDIELGPYEARFLRVR